MIQGQDPWSEQDTEGREPLGGYGVSKRFGFPNAPIGTFLSASPIFIVDTAAGKLGNWQSENHYPTPWKRNFSVWQAQEPR